METMTDQQQANYVDAILAGKVPFKVLLKTVQGDRIVTIMAQRMPSGGFCFDQFRATEDLTVTGIAMKIAGFLVPLELQAPTIVITKGSEINFTCNVTAA